MKTLKQLFEEKECKKCKYKKLIKICKICPIYNDCFIAFLEIIIVDMKDELKYYADDIHYHHAIQDYIMNDEGKKARECLQRNFE